MASRPEMYAPNVSFALANLPTEIEAAASALDLARTARERLLLTLSIDALSLSVFPGKTSEDPQRPASNERERDLAIQHTCQQNEQFVKCDLDYLAALRHYNQLRDQQTNLRLVAELLVAGLK